ncbi:hypothetical protein DNTS_007058 [Danionella cerebrum]|uniref:Leucine-rich repeat and IQ domain-containing protein 1 n=1 Tax=Danionella cerebrum TaxID=2873325 RepID=A0A553QR62_9TELE|nr:hypothetical protein DNTS_007058 [Danionella translucida]
MLMSSSRMDEVEQALDDELMKINLHPTEADSDDDCVTGFTLNLEEEDELPVSLFAYVESSRNQVDTFEQLILEDVEDKDFSSQEQSYLNQSTNATSDPASDLMYDPLNWKERVIIELEEQVGFSNSTESHKSQLDMSNVNECGFFTETEIQFCREWRELEKRLKEEEEMKLAAQENDPSIHPTYDVQLELEKQQRLIHELDEKIRLETQAFEEAQEEERRRKEILRYRAAIKIQTALRGALARRWSKTEMKRKREEDMRQEEEKRLWEMIKKEREDERRRVEEEERLEREEAERRRVEYERAKEQERHRLEREQRLEQQKMTDINEEIITKVKDDYRKQEEEAFETNKDKESIEVQDENGEKDQGTGVKSQKNIVSTLQEEKEKSLSLSTYGMIRHGKKRNDTFVEEKNTVEQQEKLKSIDLDVDGKKIGNTSKDEIRTLDKQEEYTERVLFGKMILKTLEDEITGDQEKSGKSVHSEENDERIINGNKKEKPLCDELSTVKNREKFRLHSDVSRMNTVKDEVGLLEKRQSVIKITGHYTERKSNGKNTGNVYKVRAVEKLQQTTSRNRKENTVRNRHGKDMENGQKEKHAMEKEICTYAEDDEKERHEKKAESTLADEIKSKSIFCPEHLKCALAQRMSEEEEKQVKLDCHLQQSQQTFKMSKPTMEFDVNAHQHLSSDPAISPDDLSTTGEDDKGMSADLIFGLPKALQIQESLCLPDCTEKKRLAWMMSCIPWSKLSCQNKRKGSSAYKRAHRRRGPSLPPLSEDTILKTGAWDSLKQVTTVTLENLPGCSLSTLSECHKLQTLTMRQCGLTSLDGLNQCTQIRYIDVQLMNIHGLDGAENLQSLQLSHNNISRISGLGTLKNLLQLSVDHNHLLSTTGLKEIYTLLHLDCSYNHLSHVEGLENCALLNTLDLRGNSLTELPILQNHVLLRDLYLDDNLLSNIEDLESYWLPLLRNLSLANNSITHLNPFLDFVSLRVLDVSHNCLSDFPNACSSIQTCISLQELHLTGNPLMLENTWRSLILGAVPSLIRLNNEQIAVAPAAFRKAPEQQCSFLGLCQSQQEQRDSVLHRQKMKTSAAASDLLANSHKTELFRLAVEQRYAHEYGDSSVPEDAALATANIGRSCDSSETSSQRQLPEKQSPSSHSSPSPCEFQSAECSQSEREPLQASKLKIAAAVRIQRFWRRRRKGPPGLIEKTNSKFNLHKVEDTCNGRPEREHAAAVIQAVWRGYFLRKRLSHALAAAQITESDEDFEEVDMDGFIFDEKELEEDWKTLNSQALLARMMPLQEEEHLPKTVSSRQPKTAWIESEEADFLEQSISHQHSSRSLRKLNALAEKSEQIREEWGITDDSTACLILKRANKIKGVPRARNLDHRSASAEQEQDYREKTLRWLRSQADSKRHPFLPDIGQEILNGGRVQLVATGDRDGRDSVSRVWSEPQKQARRCTADNKKLEVPSPTRVNSAPTRNERISFRDNPVRHSGGWGGGKKRLNK